MCMCIYVCIYVCIDIYMSALQQWPKAKQPVSTLKLLNCVFSAPGELKQLGMEGKLTGQAILFFPTARLFSTIYS